MLRMLICLGLNVGATVVLVGVWLHYGEKTDALIIVSAICFGTFAFSTGVHLAIGACCPKRNCWPDLIRNEPLMEDCEDDDADDGMDEGGGRGSSAGGGSATRNGSAAAASSSAAATASAPRSNADSVVGADAPGGGGGNGDKVAESELL